MAVGAYSVGRPVSSLGGSTAPQSGATLDPEGYIDRGLNSGAAVTNVNGQIGADGASDARSGLAGAALGRLAGTGVTSSSVSAPGVPSNNQAVPVTAGRTGRVLYPQTDYAIGPDGTMHQVNLAAPAPTGGKQIGSTQSTTDDSLPYDATYAQGLADQTYGLNATLSNIEAGRHSAGDQYVLDQNRAALAEDGTERGLINAAAARGMAMSSGYGTAQGLQQDSYASQLANLLTGYNGQLSAYDQQKLAAQVQEQTAVQALRAAAVKRLQAQTGLVVAAPVTTTTHTGSFMGGLPSIGRGI